MPDRRIIKKMAIKLLPALVVCGIILAIFYYGGIDLFDDPGTLADKVANSGNRGIFLFLTILIVTGSVVPPVLFIIASGLLWPFHQALAISFFGGLAATFIGFFISRHTAHAFFARHIPKKLLKYSHGIREHGIKTTITLRLIFFLFPPVNWLLGISHVRVRDYLLGTIIGCIPGMFIYTYLGDDWIPWLLEKPVTRPATIFGIYATVATASFAIRRLLKKRRGEDDQGPTITTLLFLNSAALFGKLAFTTFFPPKPHPRPGLKRCLVMLVFLPTFAILQLTHWFAFFLDELLFPRYRDIPIQAPLFIVGIPRSGTTHLHRVLARDTQRFTTVKLWQALFAPAICERKLLRLLARIDCVFGRPMLRIANRIMATFTDELDAVHKLSLQQPEEDFALLMPVLACFILVAAFPQSDDIANLAFFDSRLPEKRRREIMTFYRGMLQRHLYCVGTQKTILSKNVSFTPMLESLNETFPDARFVACIRAPEETVPSQISSMAQSWHAFGNPSDTPDFAERWVELIEHYCMHLDHVMEHDEKNRIECVAMQELKENLDTAVHRLYTTFGFQLNSEFAEVLSQEEEAARQYQSRHCYQPEDFKLDKAEIPQRFSDVWNRLKKKIKSGTAP
jgi:uncharacterized membrane protein YdjX (TVP38/TMEM64 family)